MKAIVFMGCVAVLAGDQNGTPYDPSVIYHPSLGVGGLLMGCK